MKVVIVGAGEVGSNIAESLSSTHEIVVIDIDAERTESLLSGTDVLSIQGDGTDRQTLLDAEAGEADLFIASTDDDETNLVACGTVKTIGNPFTIARVKNSKFLDTWRQAEGAFGVDSLVGTNQLTAETIVRVIGLPGARDVERFADGMIQMAEFEIPSDSPVAGQSVQEADRWDSLTFAAVLRNGDVLIPTGSTRIQSGDDLIVIGAPESVKSFAADLTVGKWPGKDVLVLGGTDIAFQTAQLLTEEGISTRLIERNPERARWLAEELPKTTVLLGDAIDRDFLKREHIETVDVVIAAFEEDEKNLLSSLLATRMGAGRSVAVVADGDYVPLFEAVGVDVAVNPLEATAEEITRFTRERYAENVAIIASDRAEVLELEINEDSILTGRQIRDSMGDLPKGIVIGAITRGDSHIIPRGDTEVQVGDHVIAFVDANILDTVSDLL